jgi:NitT/TauT family transport system substrate-binding protein
MRCVSVRAWFVLVILGSAVVPVKAATALVFGITSGTALSLPHFIAADRNFYAAEGLAVDTIIAGAAGGVLQQLAAGSLNMAQAATDQSLRAIIRGAPVRIIAGAAANAPFRLIAAKGIKSWSDLKGRFVSVGGPTDVTLYFLHVMARRNGLADHEYDTLYGGGTPSRFAQLAAGAVSAAMLTNPVDFAALDQGFVELGSVPDYLPNWAQNNILVNTGWAEHNRRGVLSFLRAQMRAIRFLYDPANRAEVVAILARQTRVALPVAQATYDLFIRERVIAADAALSASGIAANLEALVAIGDLRENVPLSRVIDASFLRDAKAGQP